MSFIRSKRILVLALALCLLTAHYATSGVKIKVIIGGDPKVAGSLESISDATSLKGKTYFVVDPEAVKIKVFDKTGNWLREFGEKGKKPGQLWEPFGIALYTSKLYITDRKLDRVSVFDLSGRFLFSFADSGGAPGKLDTPTGITISDQERVYVVDSGNHRVAVFTTEGVFLQNLATDSLRAPMYIAKSSSGVVYVSDPKAKAIYAIDDAGSVSEVIRSNDSFKIVPSGIAVDDHGSLLFMEQETSKVYMIRGGGGPVPILGSEGKGRGQFKEPEAMQLIGNELLIADSGNYRLQVIEPSLPKDMPTLAAAQSLPRVKLINVQIGKPYVDIASDEKGRLFALIAENLTVHSLQPDGTFKKELGRVGRKKKPPKGVSIAAGKGLVYVADAKRNTIHCFTYAGKHKFSFGEKGKKAGYLHNPAGMAVHGDKLYIAERGNKRVQIFSTDGVALAMLEAPGQGFKDPIDVAVSNSTGNIFVADAGLEVVFTFNPQGKISGVFGLNGIPHEIPEIASIDVDEDGRVYVLGGKGGERVRIYNEKGVLKVAFGAAGVAKAELKAPSGFAVVKGTIFIADAGNERLVAYSFKEVPATPKNMLIMGDESSSTITWEGGAESFLKGFKIYGVNPRGERKLLSETKEEKFEVAYPMDGDYKRFAVSAVSNEGLESPQAGPIMDKFHVGLSRYKAGEINEATPYLEAAFKDNPDHGKALEYLGKVYMKARKYDRAFEAFTDLSKMKGFREEGYFNLGLYYFEKDELDNALDEFERAHGVMGLSSMSLLYMAKVYLKRQNLRKAVELAQEADLVDTKNPEVYEVLGLAFHGQKLYGKAGKNLTTAIGLDPDNVLLYRELAAVYVDQGKVKDAIEKLKKAQKMAPDDMGVKLDLGEAMLLMEDYDAALVSARLVIRAEPKKVKGYILKAKAEIKLKRTEDAVVSLEKALELDPESEYALIGLGVTYLELGNKEQANKNLDKLLELYPQSVDARLAYARSKLKMGQVDDAISSFEKAIEINPLDDHAYLELGKIHIMRKDYARAIEPLKRARELAPGSIEALLDLGKAYTESDKKAEAMDIYEEAININPDWGAAHFELGNVLFAALEYEKAIRELRLAAYIEPANPEYHFELGKAFLAVEEIDAAIVELKKASEINPTEEYKRELSLAFEQKKKYKRSGNVPPVEVAELIINPVFTALHKFYADNPIGSYVIKNNRGKGIYKVKTSVRIKKYMDYPSEMNIPKIAPRSTQKVDIFATFNDQILTLKEDTPALAEVVIIYYSNRNPLTVKLSVPFTIYGINALTWSDKEMVAAFSTPTDWPVSEFARGIMAMYVDEGPTLAPALLYSMRLFDALGAYGVSYIPDPNRPYSVSSRDHSKVDTVQFPRETLKAKSGDCDDLVVLMISLLENLGIETALVDIPGHVFIMLNTGVPSTEIDNITSNHKRVVIIDDIIWLPLEMTMVGKPFTAAWNFASDQYNEAERNGEVNIVRMHKAWKRYSPASLPLEEWAPKLPKKAEVDSLYQEEKNSLSMKLMEREVGVLLKAIEANPDDVNSSLKLGVLYAKRGYPGKSRDIFEAILAKKPGNPDALNNLGNIAFIAEDFPKALDLYKRAEAEALTDALIKINLSMCLFRAGELELARTKFEEATEIDPDLEIQNRELKSYLFE